MGELKDVAKGFRWGRRALVPRNAEPHAPERDRWTFPTDWARTPVGSAAREVLLKLVMQSIVWNETAPEVHGLDNLEGVGAPVIFFSNHSSHLDATLILTTLPKRWLEKTAVAAAKDYFFDVWWRAAFTALVYAGVPIERGGGAKATAKAKELLRDGWSLVLFPEGTRSQDGFMQRFRHGTARLCLEMNVAAVPIAIVGAYAAMPKGRNWPRPGRPPISVRYGPAIVPEPGETHQAFSTRMREAVELLFDEDRSTWWEALHRAEKGETPKLAGPAGADWVRMWQGQRYVPRRGPKRAWPKD